MGEVPPPSWHDYACKRTGPIIYRLAHAPTSSAHLAKSPKWTKTRASGFGKVGTHRGLPSSTTGCGIMRSGYFTVGNALVVMFWHQEVVVRSVRG